jgi:ribosomal protein L35
MKSHILGKKNSKRRRRLDEPVMLKKGDARRAKALLGK